MSMKVTVLLVSILLGVCMNRMVSGQLNHFVPGYGFMYIPPAPALIFQCANVSCVPDPVKMSIRAAWGSDSAAIFDICSRTLDGMDVCDPSNAKMVGECILKKLPAAQHLSQVLYDYSQTQLDKCCSHQLTRAMYLCAYPSAGTIINYGQNPISDMK